MKKLTSLMIILLLVGCSKPAGEQGLPVKPNEPIIVEPIEQVGYIEEFGDYDFTGEKEVTVDDRHFLTEDMPRNVAETLVFDHYYYDILANWEKTREITAKDNEALQISIDSAEKHFNEDCYIREYIIHSLSILTQKEAAELKTTYGPEYEKDVDKYDLKTYTMVKVTFTMAHSQASLNRIPQIGDGEYTRYFLCGTTEDEESWKIYELYM